MVDIVIYEAEPKGYVKEVDRIPNIETLDDARLTLLELYEVYIENPGWNIKEVKINHSLTEGHIYVYCRDEHYMLVIEDPGKQSIGEAWNERINARLEME